MATISITTTQNIELEYELAGLGERILARIIDWIVIIAYAGVFLALIGLSNIDTFFDNNGWFILIIILPIFFYDLISELWLDGQSLGKKAMAIKVISLNGEQPSAGQYLIRWLFRIIDFSFSGSLCALISVAVTEKHQRLGDIIAGTTLVKTKARTGFNQTIFTPTIDEQYIITYPEAINLSDRDMQLIKEVILNVQKSGNTMLALQTMNKIEQVLHITSKHHPMDFLHIVLKDYNHLSSKL